MNRKRKFVNDDHEWQATCKLQRVKNPSTWQTIGNDSWTKIVSFLDIPDHFMFERVSKTCQRIGHKTQSWGTHLRLDCSPRTHRDFNSNTLKRFWNAPFQYLCLCLCPKQRSTLCSKDIEQLLTSLTELTDVMIDFQLPISEESWTRCVQSWPKLKNAACFMDGSLLPASAYLEKLRFCKQLTFISISHKGKLPFSVFQQLAPLRIREFFWFGDEDSITPQVMACLAKWPLETLHILGKTPREKFIEYGFDYIGRISTLKTLYIDDLLRWEGHPLGNYALIPGLKSIELNRNAHGDFWTAKL